MFKARLGYIMRLCSKKWGGRWGTKRKGEERDGGIKMKGRKEVRKEKREKRKKQEISPKSVLEGYRKSRMGNGGRHREGEGSSEL